MGTFEVEPAELEAMSAMIRGLQQALHEPMPLALPGGGGTPEIDDGYFTLAGHCGSRMRHAANAIESLAATLEAAATAYSGTDDGIASSVAQSAAVQAGGK